MRLFMARGFGAALLCTALLSIPTLSRAQCWICEHQDNMYVCVGAGNGNGDLFTCGPTWDDEPPYTCKTDDSETCGATGCPGCLRYPAVAAAIVPRPRLVATQILVFRSSAAPARAGVATYHISGADGLSADRVAADLRLRGAVVGTLIGASVETGPDGTLSQHRATDGSGAAIQATAVDGRVHLRFFALGENAVASRVSQIDVAGDEAAVLPIRIEGHSCLIVVHAVASEHVSLDEVLQRYHTPFTQAAQSYQERDLSALQVTSLRSASAAVQGSLARSMASSMLSSVTQTAYR